MVVTLKSFDFPSKVMLLNNKRTIAATSDKTIAISGKPAPTTIPTLIDQNINTRSKGFFKAVLKRTIDKAPTIPRDTTTLD